MASWTKRQGEVTSHSRSYGEELQRSIFVQIASAIGDLESAIGITCQLFDPSFEIQIFPLNFLCISLANFMLALVEMPFIRSPVIRVKSLDIKGSQERLELFKNVIFTLTKDVLHPRTRSTGFFA